MLCPTIVDYLRDFVVTKVLELVWLILSWIYWDDFDQYYIHLVHNICAAAA